MEEVSTAHHPEASGQVGKRLEERFWSVTCDKVTRKAVPVVEPQRLPHLTGLPPIQVDELKITLHTERPYQGLPEGGLQEILCLHMQREIRHPLLGIPTLNRFVNGFLDRHGCSPAPSPGLILIPILAQ